MEISLSRSRLLTKSGFVLLSLTFLLGGSELSADEVTKWNETADQAAFNSGLVGNPIFQSRLYAITHAAIHDALNVIDRRYEAYKLKVPFELPGSPDAAVATAAYDVLTNQFDLLIPFGVASPKALLDAAYASSLASIPDGLAKKTGITIGRLAAKAVLALRASDGWNTNSPGLRIPARDGSRRVSLYASFHVCLSARMGRTSTIRAS